MNIKYIGRCHGKSMSPLLNPGDKIFIKKVGCADLKIGDVVVFFHKKQLISHRIIFKGRGKIITKGDNSLSLDSAITCDQVLGRVVRIEGKYGLIITDSWKAEICNFYFLLYSLITYLPIIVFNISTSVIRGRRFLVKLLRKK